MARTAWILEDYSSGEMVSFEFPINPHEFSPPGRSGNFTIQSTTAPSGQPIIFAGGPSIPTGSMGGTVLTEEMRLNLDAWANKWYPVLLKDDLEHAWAILITRISWTRVHRTIYPNRYTYSIEMMFL